jgi:hypothetical protein
MRSKNFGRTVLLEKGVFKKIDASQYHLKNPEILHYR